MKLGIVISTREPETTWNAFRLANFALAKKDEVSVFLVGQGVDYDRADTARFDAVHEAGKFVQSGGRIMACGTCLKTREKPDSPLCPISSLAELYELITASDKVVSF